MTIDEKMIYIRRALELGADVDLSFHNVREEEKAELLATELSHLTSLPYEERNSEGSNWFKLNYRGNRHDSLEIAIFFDQEKEEEVSA